MWGTWSKRAIIPLRPYCLGCLHCQTRALPGQILLFVNPTAIGAGMPVLPNLGTHQPLRLVTRNRSTAGTTA
jgi:hypothetical protein